MKVNYIGSVSADHFTESFLPLFEESVPVGFPSPANDYLEAPIDLNKYLIKNQVATFLVRAVGDSMIGANIGNNAILIVDRSIKPSHGSIVIASIDNEFICKKLQLKPKIALLPENEKYDPIYIERGQNFEVLGVVIATINQFK